MQSADDSGREVGPSPAEDRWAEERERLLAQLREANERATQSALAAQEAAERESALLARLRTLVDTMAAGIVMADARGAIEMANAAASAILGTATGTEAVPHKGRTLHRPDGSPFPAHDLSLARALERGEPAHDVEILVRRGDEVERVILASGTPVRDAGGAVTGAVAVLLDVTERRRTEQTLRESEERFRTMVEQSPISIQIFSPDGRTLQVNRA